MPDQVVALVFYAIIHFVPGVQAQEPYTCARITVEPGQVACYSPLDLAGVSLIHPAYVDHIERGYNARYGRR